jgi:uncharacterized protein (DUF1684 family)
MTGAIQHAGRRSSLFRHCVVAVMTALALGAGIAACGRPGDVLPTPDREAADAAVRAWREKHEADYRRDWVSIAGLHVLEPGANSAGSDPASDIVLPASTPRALGRFVLEGERVRFEPAPGAEVLLEDRPVTSAIDLRDDRSREVDELKRGDVRLSVHVSGDTRSIRVRDPNGPLARGFLGFSWFPVDAQYRVVGRFVKDPEPQRFKVLNTYGHADEYTTEGIVEFQLLGQTLRLRPFTTRPKRFYFVFRDASSGHETYETARFLYSDLRDDGTTVLDFNMAYNPPCAFNPYTTCPIPLRENRLPVKVLAGEKAYPVPVPLPGASPR